MIDCGKKLVLNGFYDIRYLSSKEHSLAIRPNQSSPRFASNKNNIRRKPSVLSRKSLSNTSPVFDDAGLPPGILYEMKS